MAWLDRASRPEPDTRGDFEEPAFVQAAVSSSVEGLAISGVSGVLSATAASMAGLYVEKKSKSEVLSLLTGVGVGATLSAITAASGGPAAMTTRAMTGALLGAFETLGGNRRARVRDAGDASMISGLYLHGPAKMAAGIASAAAQRWGPQSSPRARMLVGGLLGASLGAGLAAVGYTPVGVLPAALVSGTAGAVGLFFGPRYAQFFRNVGKRTGGALDRGLQTAGLTHKPLPPRIRNTLGALPAGVGSEALKVAIYADGGPLSIVVGGLAAGIQMGDIYLRADAKNAPAREPR
jgi:hypothetical protein